eukprot:scaffold4819_cov83-Skeletonema_menzelii.AAC.1
MIWEEPPIRSTLIVTRYGVGVCTNMARNNKKGTQAGIQQQMHEVACCVLCLLTREIGGQLLSHHQGKGVSFCSDEASTLQSIFSSKER